MRKDNHQVKQKIKRHYLNNNLTYYIYFDRSGIKPFFKRLFSHLGFGKDGKFWSIYKKHIIGSLTYKDPQDSNQVVISTNSLTNYYVKQLELSVTNGLINLIMRIFAFTIALFIMPFLVGLAIFSYVYWAVLEFIFLSPYYLIRRKKYILFKQAGNQVNPSA